MFTQETQRFLEINPLFMGKKSVDKFDAWLPCKPGKEIDYCLALLEHDKDLDIHFFDGEMKDHNGYICWLQKPVLVGDNSKKLFNDTRAAGFHAFPQAYIERKRGQWVVNFGEL